MYEEQMAKLLQALVAKMRGKKPIGSPRTRWKDLVMINLKLLQKRAQIDMAYKKEE
jgi:hypothetical protein